MSQPVVYQIVGYKNTGKTTLICQLIPILTASGLQVGTVKHDAHGFQVDEPGKDTWKHRQAGASMTAITSPERTAWMREQAAKLDELIRTMSDVDIILVEGFKREPYPKLVIARTAEDIRMSLELTGVDAVVWRPVDGREPAAAGPQALKPEAAELNALEPETLPVFSATDVAGIAAHIMKKRMS